MAETYPDGDVSYETLQLEIAKADLKLKQMEIRYKPGPWKQLLTNPILIAGMITAYVTVGTAYITAQRAREQERIDNIKHLAQLALEEHKLEASVMIETAKVSNPDNFAQRMLFFLDIGMIKDPSGKLRKFLETHPRITDPPPPAQ